MGRYLIEGQPPKVSRRDPGLKGKERLQGEEEPLDA
jgi:hypothetical protein